jgi:endonuclease YncB( thermonuclease family)
MNLARRAAPGFWAALSLPLFAVGARGGDAVERTRSPVLFVADGTTLVVRLDGQARRVRLEGVEEVDSGPWERRSRRLEATRFLRSLAADREVALEFGPGDRAAGRARVRRVDDGLWINREVVARGFGVPTASSEGEADLLRLAAEARSGRLGLWGEPPPPSTAAQSTGVSRPAGRRQSVRRAPGCSVAARQASAVADQQFWNAFSLMMASLPPPDV